MKLFTSSDSEQKKVPKKRESPADIPQMPFDDALRKILNAPPQHKTAKKKK